MKKHLPPSFYEKNPKKYIPLVFYSNVEFLAKFLMNYLSIRLKAIIGEFFASITSLIDECFAYAVLLPTIPD